jgi:hypothetical protein
MPDEQTTSESMDGEKTQDDATRVDHDTYWNLEEIDAKSEIYAFVGKGGPPSSKAVAKAKQQFAQDYDVKFRHCKGKKIGTAPGRAGGPIVVVVHRPKMATHDVLP